MRLRLGQLIILLYTICQGGDWPSFTPPSRVRPMFLVACVGRIMDAANTRKNEALGASVMRRSATSNLTPKFLGHTPPSLDI